MLRYPFCRIVFGFVSETLSGRCVSDILWVANLFIPIFPFGEGSYRGFDLCMHGRLMVLRVHTNIMGSRGYLVFRHAISAQEDEGTLECNIVLLYFLSSPCGGGARRAAARWRRRMYPRGWTVRISLLVFEHWLARHDTRSTGLSLS